VAPAEQPDLRRADRDRGGAGAAVPDGGVARPVGPDLRGRRLLAHPVDRRRGRPDQRAHGVAVHSAGYVRLERDQGPHLRQPTSPASPGPSLRASAAQEAIAGAGISTRSAYAYQRTSQSEQNQCMGRSTSLRVAAWDEASRPHDQHKAKHRQGRTGPAFLALPIPLHDPGTSTRPPSCAFATLRTGGWPPPRVGSSAATHPTGVTRVTYPRAIADWAASIEG
jgi:hypothetical protein